MTTPIELRTSPTLPVTIITVTLNSAGHVAGAVESVIAQDDPTVEYLVIDGGSSDETVAIVEGYRDHFGARLRIVSERDDGLYDAMNKGIALASGDVVGILNSDDAYLPGTVAAVREAFIATGADVVFGDLLLRDPRGARVLHASILGMSREMTIFHPATFARADAYRRFGGFDTRFRIAADYDLLLRFRRNGAQFTRVDRPLAAFAPGGLSSRPLRLAREMYIIHRIHFSALHALRCAADRIMRHAFLELRRWIGHLVLGMDRYDRLATHVRRRRSPMP